jgi:hypothetical protein
MTFGHEEHNVSRGAAIHDGAAGDGGAGIDTDSDSDSDPEAGSSETGLPDKLLEATRLSWPVPRAASCAGGSTAPRCAARAVIAVWLPSQAGEPGARTGHNRC